MGCYPPTPVGYFDRHAYYPSRSHYRVLFSGPEDSREIVPPAWVMTAFSRDGGRPGSALRSWGRLQRYEYDPEGSGRVRYVLEGSVRRAGNTLRITAQLIDASSDSQLWSAKYGGTMSDVFEVQERVAREIVSALGISLTSDEDRNWDSVRELWTLKEKVKKSGALKRAFDANDTADGVMRALEASDEGRGLLKEIDTYKNEYGNKSMYAHEYIYTTWRENPTPIVEALRGYLVSDYDYEKDVRHLRENRDAAISEM
jgi:hypothetical protein